MEDSPLQNIGIAFSGGGFRAAAFALGTISYLEKVPWNGKSLLESATFFTSTSGGSITNAFYTLRLHEGQAPAEIMRELYAHLADSTVLEQALEMLTNRHGWGEYPHKTRNLINAFAITYDKLLFRRKTLADYHLKVHQPHVQEVCFNATELNNGISFRFRTSGQESDVVSFGNYYLNFKKEYTESLKSLRIADMVAASSCFPVGFEPIVFPDDFAAGEESPESLLAAFEIDHNDELRKATVQAQAFGLIDGGVVDNQGIYSLGLEDSRRPRKKEHLQALENPAPSEAKPENNGFDLMIVCDVASYFLEPYPVPKPTAAWWARIPLKAIVVALALIVPLTGVTVGVFIANHEPWYYYLLLLPAYLSSGLIGLGFWKATKAVLAAQSTIQGRMLRKFVGRLLNFPLSKYLELLQARSRSFAQLALHVYLKQIRRLHLDKAYAAEDAGLRLISNFIYELAPVHRDRRLIESKKPINAWWGEIGNRLQPSEAMENTAETARKVGTTLWFDPEKPHEIDAVVSTGQFTICYNLIRLLYRREHSLGPLSPELTALREHLMADWDAFQRDPLWMMPAIKGNPAMATSLSRPC